MVEDKELEKLLQGYRGIKSFRRNFSRDPSTDNYRLRAQIKDENDEEMFSQPAGVVDQKLGRDMEEVITNISRGLDKPRYDQLAGKYKVEDEDLLNHAYSELAGIGLIPEDASKDLKEIFSLVNQANELEDIVATKKYDQALDAISSIAGDESLNYKLAYQYNLIGQGQNVDALVNRYASMQRRVAAAKINSNIKAEIDRAIEKSDKNRAYALVERFHVYQIEQARKKAEEEAKKSEEAKKKEKRK